MESRGASQMDKLIPVVNKLQDVFASIGGGSFIDLPQIAVVGAQSSGKSSVLENIVGRDFLPRGSDIVTRRPLVLQLINCPNETQEWGEFLHKPGEKYFDFAEIRKEIEADTDRLTGGNKGISPQPINLKILSPHVLNLTLVDLPGVTKVAVGDQPKDIEQQIMKMIQTYIERPSCIILAITPANTDIANSDALKFAATVDPQGMRTLGVITKLDLMDQGTDAVDVMMGRVVPLRLGYIGVVNRSQMDINEGKTIRDAVADEQKFFRNHPRYSMMAERLGTSFLASSMNTLLISHIKQCLPALNKRVQELQQQKAKELSSYGQSDSSTFAEKGAILLGIVTQFAQDFGNIIEGKANDLVSTTEISGGARVHYIFSDIYNRAIQEISYLDGLSEQDIRTSIKNSAGYRSSLFVPETAFESLVKRQIERLLKPSEQCVQLIFEELRRIALQCERRELQRFPALRSKLYETVGSFLADLNAPTLEMVRGLVHIETSYVNMKHPEFIGGEQAVRQIFIAAEGDPNDPKNKKKASKQESKQETAPPGNSSSFMGNFFGGNQTTATPGTLKPVPAALKPSPTLTDREQREVDILKTLLQSYFTICKKTVADSVPKTIMHFLVNKARANLQTTLVTSLYKDDLLSSLLQENENLVKARQKCKEQQTLLTKAQMILTEVREFTVQ
eukprot:TRINITY_DN1605_c0_g1_i4.p1 TRINITY_DN1605_c0_g1~~TRINITY_DN1605_c0_g1_i4.p1  ORF type:complete len:677 (-),score=149.15 TRINITY_DN1605_c0_g1_i4:391-2421(-)